MSKKDIIEQLKDGLIVSCQAVEDEPHYMEGITVKFAECAAWAGAVGIRADTPEDVRAIKEKVDLPVIGIWKIKRNINDVYLTPNLEAAKALWDAGAEIIAVQATNHLREDGKKSYETIKEIKKHIPEALIFADVATAEDAKIAAEYGADFVAPTLAGYTKAGYFDKIQIKDAPDYILLKDVIEAVKGSESKVIMEGKVATPEIAVQCLYMGAYAVVVGNAITRPHITAKRFARALNRYQDE
jgi:Putative N-acetylmannosamine-6-phosphate epimerase